MIADDVARAVEAVDGVHRVEVVGSRRLWTTERISPSARLRLAQEFPVVRAAPSPCAPAGHRTGFRRRADALPPGASLRRLP